MIGICPTCEKNTELTFISQTEEITVRGENIPVHVEYLKCAECDSEFNDPNSTYDMVEQAFIKYREIHGLANEKLLNDDGVTVYLGAKN